MIFSRFPGIPVMLLRVCGAPSTPTSSDIRRDECDPPTVLPVGPVARRDANSLLRFLLAAALVCWTVQIGRADAETILGRAEVTALIVAAEPGVKDAAGWAQDILDNLAALKIPQTEENICAVLAVVDQESGFVANPAVPQLGAIAVQAMEKELRENAEYRIFFSLFPHLKREFMDRVRAAKTERDLDLASRHLMDSIRIKESERVLELLMRLFGGKASLVDFFESKNKISTIGSMQVSVRSALAAERQYRGAPLTLDQVYRVRDFLYTRSGGLYAGIRQLLGYETGYSRKLYRFADYNAGRYSSRNAAFQMTVAVLSGDPMELDGDLLKYKTNGAPEDAKSATERAIAKVASQFDAALPEEQIRRDLLLEKEFEFSESVTFRMIREFYNQQTGNDPPFAVLPDIRLRGIKITRPLTTEWYAKRLDQKYQDCIVRTTR